MRAAREWTSIYFRNLIFGVEDGLVSTVGLLSGIAIAEVPRETIILTGVVLIFVEAVSMAAGSFLSEASVEELETRKRTSPGESFKAGSTMFASYFVAGFVPLAPYIWLGDQAFQYSIYASIIALFLLGAWTGKLSRAGILRSALRMSIVGGIAVLVGATAGFLLG